MLIDLRSGEIGVSQVTLLSTNGETLREYWHIGAGVARAMVADPDGDGRKEICLAGVSNPRNMATSVILDPHVRIIENRKIQ
jgi:hypothetical protein